MVQRATEPLNFQRGDGPQVLTQGPGLVGPRNTQGIFDTQVGTKHANLVTPPSAEVSPVLKALFGVGSELVQSAIERRQQEAYLDGALAVGTVASEQELDTDLMTRQWKIAGYRDTLGRLAIADYEAQVSKDMERLREQSPEKMAEYLRIARKRVMPVLQSMSAEARAKLLPEFLTSERSSLATHAKEHMKFVYDTHNRSLQAGVSERIRKVKETDGPHDPAYQPAVDALGTWLYTNVWENPALPYDTKVALFQEAIASSMADGDLGLYTWVREMPLSMPDGSTSTIWDNLPLKTQKDLAQKYLPTLNTHQYRVQREWTTQDMEYYAAIKTGEGLPSPDTYMQHLHTGLQLGVLSSSEAKSAMGSYMTTYGEQSDVQTIVRATLSGDVATLKSMGKTSAAAAKTTAEYIMKNSPPDQGFAILVQAGVSTGNTDLMAEAGSLVAPPIARMMNIGGDPSKAGNIPESAYGILSTFSTAYDDAIERGDTSAAGSYLKLLPEEQRAWLSVHRDLVSKNGADPTAPGTIVQVNSIMQGVQNETAEATAIRVADARKKAVGYLDKLDSQGPIGRGAGWFYQILSPRERMRREVVPYKSWFENPTVYDANQEAVKNAFLDEVGKAARLYPGRDEDAIINMALAEVQSRAIPTERGVAIIPRGANMHTMFSAPAVVNPDQIGEALSRLSRDIDWIQDDFGFEYAFDNGIVSVRVYNSDGGAAGIFDFPATAVGEKVREIVEEGGEKYNREMGEGFTYKDPKTGASVHFDGRNSAGIHPSVAFNIRRTIVNYEGVTDLKYPDGTSGGHSIGVGFYGDNFPKGPENYTPDGRLKPEVISEKFDEISDKKLQAANNMMNKYGLPLHSEAALTLLTHLAYQGGAGADKYESSKVLFEAIKSGDPHAAYRAVLNTVIHKAAKGDRRKFYERLAKQAAVDAR